MITEDFIKELRSKSRLPKTMAIRQSVYYLLYKQGLSGNELERHFACTKRNIYYGMYSFRDRLSMKDEVSVAAYQESLSHEILCKGDKINGYVITIDGVEL